MMSVKKKKKTVITIITQAVIASILMSAAAAEEINFSRPETEAVSFAAAVVTLPAAEFPVLPPFETIPAEDASKSTGSGTETASPISENATDTHESLSEPAENDTAQLIREYMPDLVSLAGQTIADYTMQYDGFKYVYGAESPRSGFDCSGLVYYVYTHFGYTLPRTASRQFNNGVSVETTELQPGDLVFFATSGGRSVSHVGIYIGDGQFIHASTERHGVMTSSLDNSYWCKAFIGAKRIVTPQAAYTLLYQPAFMYIT